MRCCSSGLSNACGVLHQWRVPIAEPAKTLPTPRQLVGMMDARSCWVVVQHDRPGDLQAACAFHCIPGVSGRRPAAPLSPCAQAGLGTFNFCRGTALHLLQGATTAPT
ncbi:unnamed protein product [Parnassius apollo]|uniref:(apollo) hypothetical protein n=1 Tax=Parnassius apollo TaxID=110799 RepID=A0A8S3WL55_PARAO|nr:unnamed protein product [Parnassius apollo]